MTDLRTRDTPLLTEHKLQYVLRLLPQTLFGGIKLRFGFTVPCLIYLIQILIWVLPGVIGAASTLLFCGTGLNRTHSAVICGLLMFLLCTAINLIVLYLKASNEMKFTMKAKRSNFLAEEDEIDFSTVTSAASLECLFPKKQLIVNYLLHPLIAAVVCGFGLLFLLPSSLKNVFNNKDGSIIYCGFGWSVICTMCYPLVGQNPKELSKFYDLDKFDLAVLTRPIYVLSIFIWDFVTRSDSYFDHVNYVLHVVFILLPFLFVFGTLPPFDALILWSIEQLQVHVFGGSAMSIDVRLLFITLCSWVVVLVSHFIQHQTTFLILTAIFGAVMSLDCTSFCYWSWNFIKVGPWKRKRRINVGTNKINGHVVELKYFCKIAFILIAAGLVSGVAKLNIDTLHTQTSMDACGYILCLLFIIYILLCNQSQVYIMCGFIRNPLFARIPKNVIRSLLYLIHTFVLPLYLVFVGSIVFVPRNLKSIEFHHKFLMIRIFQMPWRNPFRLSCDIILFYLLEWCDFSSLHYKDLQPTLKLFVISMVIFWSITAGKKLWFIVLLMINSVRGQRDQGRKVNTAICFTIAFLPFTLLTLVVSAILNSPLLPLFTLPIFIVGFPRPLRMWPYVNKASKSTSSSDWVYYEQLTPSVLNEIRNCSHLSIVAKAGDYFLLRFHDRIIFISVFEHGLFYKKYLIKGLELQETSCHTEEAQFLDDILDTTFKSHNQTIVNPYPLTGIYPIDVLELKGYSDAKSILTGIIDNIDFLQNYGNYFPKVLLWLLIRHCLHRKKMDCDNDDNRRLFVTDKKLTFSTGSQQPTTASNNAEKFTISLQTDVEKNLETNAVHNLKEHNKPIAKHANGYKNDSDDEFDNFSFGSDELSSSDNDDVIDESIFNENTHFGEMENNLIVSTASTIVDIPFCWKQSMPFTESDMSLYSHLFPRDWYRLTIKSLLNKDVDEILEDNTLFRVYRNLVLNCHYLINIVGLIDNSVVKEGAGHIHRVFNGQLPWSNCIAWIDGNSEIKDLVVKACRFTFKFLYDMEVFGGDVTDATEELLPLLQEYEDNWYFGSDNTDAWSSNVLNETPNLLSLAFDKSNTTFTSRLLTKQSLQAPVVKLNTECVQGVWSALLLELYYMTNDDEERYSIQALPPLLRNIIVQAADPPLGYPVYTSGLMTLYD